jgi:tetratricopeptide (TPR) repeat protein
MDSLITAAARALAAGDPLGALNRVALRDDPAALALRGIAMAQLGDFVRARALIKNAARAFGPRETVARARCAVAEAEIALASRDLGWPTKALDAARVTLTVHGDHANAAYARYLEGRRCLLIGRLDDAESILEELDPALLPPALHAAHELLVAGIAMQRVKASSARAALSRATVAAQEARIPALAGEVARAQRILDTPAARSIVQTTERLLLLDDVEALLASPALIVDACRNVVRHGVVVVSFATRPVLFALVRQLAEACPGDVPRETLIARVFRTKHPDETHRARLRVEMGRLRQALTGLADINATTSGFVLTPRATSDIVVLVPAMEDAHAPLLALLADGESWSSSALALALGASQRNVQRGLEALAASGKVESFGHGRALRWTAPALPGFATRLLLTTPLPGD